jgi:hypothetical protein
MIDAYVRLRHSLGRIIQLCWRACRLIFTGCAYWAASGIAGCWRPRIPRRFGYGPFKSTTQYALTVAFYPIALTAWLVGTFCPGFPGRTSRRSAKNGAHPDTVRQLQILTADECATACDRVHKLKHMWIPRLSGFFTLGRAGYMDCSDGQSRDKYFEDVKRFNDVLLENFGPLYQALTSALERTLGGRCRLADQYALPGFHVWLGHGIPRYELDAGSVHFDLQYLDTGLHDGLPASENVLSFTLPLRLPKAGGGLNIWDVRHPEFVGWEVWPFKRVSRVNYSLGCLVLHTGHELHQIAPVAHVDDDDERICLQGHGIKGNGMWLLYW